MQFIYSVLSVVLGYFISKFLWAGFVTLFKPMADRYREKKAVERYLNKNAK